MSVIHLLAEWAIRSSILVGTAALLLWALRVRDASIRSAAWTALLAGSLAIPALTSEMPKIILSMPQALEKPVRRVETPPVPVRTEFPPESRVVAQNAPPAPVAVEAATAKPLDWPLIVFSAYILICGVLLLRVTIGAAASLRLLRRSHATERAGIRESDRLGAPFTLGIVRPAIVLPKDWREWDGVKLDAVLAHERAHIRRYDPAVQLLSAVHRALLWISPLSWFLHQRIVRTAEEASDDAAVAATNDRAAYAEALLDFMRRGVWNSGLAGVPMARYGDPARRINRILDEIVLSRGVTGKGLAAMLMLGMPLAYVVATAQPRNAPVPQSPKAQAAPQPAPKPRAPSPAFETAEIRASAPNTAPRIRVAFSGGRFEARVATLTDLIATAWGVDSSDVIGGPEWLDQDRFDVIATAPRNSTEETRRAMLRTLLEERFHLTARQQTKSLPAYALTAGKRVQLTPSAAGAGSGSGCAADAGPTVSDPVVLTCRNITMAAFVKDLPTRWPARDYLLSYPVVDRTGLNGAWDFSVNVSRADIAWPSAATSAPIKLFDAFANQLGLKLELTNVPTTVVAVESATRPELTQPAPRKLQFEVADIRPDTPGVVRSNVGIAPGGRVTIQMTLKGLIWEAWGNVNFDRIIGGPKSMDTTGWVIIAKAPVQDSPKPGWVGPVWNGVDLDTMRQMLRSLLIDRFKLEAHEEQRMVDGYALVAAKPKLKRADASNRAGCEDGPGLEARSPNWKDPRIANPVASRLVTCQNVTLVQLAARMSTFTTEENPILPGFPPVVDATGIEGSYDLTINFSQAPAYGVWDYTGSSQDGAASAPDGWISIFEAVNKQLGLKLEPRKVTGKVLVIDHVDEKPTEN